MTSLLPAVRPWLARRLFPLLATAGLVAVGMASSDLLGTRPAGPARLVWLLHDLWGTLVAAWLLVHLDVGGPLHPAHRPDQPARGAAVILVPVAAVISAAGLSLPVPGSALLSIQVRGCSPGPT